MATPLTAAKLLAALKAEGLTVHEEPGWKDRQRDEEAGKPFGPVHGVLVHHTAGHKDKHVCRDGRPGLPGPLSHGWLGKTDGLWLLSDGRANHAGLVDLDVLRALVAEKSPLPKDDEANADGNDVLYGLEIENFGNGRDPYPDTQYEQAVKWVAAHCRAHGWSEKSVAGHKEVQPGKIDPTFDMDDFRAAVKAQLAVKPGKPPTAVPPRPKPSRPKVSLSRLIKAARTDPGARQGHITYMAGVNLVERALLLEHLLGKAFAGDGHFGTTTVRAYATWQRKLHYRGDDADGIPGRISLTKLGHASGLFTVID